MTSKTSKTSTRKTAAKPCPTFTKTRDFIKRFVALDDEQLDVAAMWVMGTWTFSPAAPAMPYTYPYLYINGPSGSGKSTLGNKVFNSICRQPQAMAGATGPALFRTLITLDPDDGSLINHWPTLLVDEIDATYNGAKDEDLRQVFNIGYTQGTVIPRSAGKVSINYPAFCPKVLMGIDNGHLPETVTNRCIRIETKIASRAESEQLEPFFPWNVDQDAAELREELASWAKDNAMVLREYEPSQGSLINRQWEISRSLVQLGKACGIESRIRDAIHSLFNRSTAKPPFKVRLYQSIFNLINETGATKLPARDVMDRLIEDGVTIPDNSRKRLSLILAEDGVSTDYVRIDKPGMFGYVEGATKHRGYYASSFDDAFVKYLSPDDED